jgi:hypothetical protein
MTIQHTRASVIVENLETDPFDSLTGVRQGDPLPATLLNLVLESVKRKLEVRGDISFKLIQLNTYTDDIARIARTKKAVIEWLIIREETALVGLHINKDKTKYMHIQRTGSINIIPLEINNYSFEQEVLGRTNSPSSLHTSLHSMVAIITLAKGCM